MIDLKELRRRAELGVKVNLDHIRVDPDILLAILDELEMKQADVNLLRSVQVVLKEERAKLLRVLERSNNLVGAGQHDFGDDCWDTFQEAVEACSDIEIGEPG